MKKIICFLFIFQLNAMEINNIKDIGLIIKDADQILQNLNSLTITQEAQKKSDVKNSGTAPKQYKQSTSTQSTTDLLNAINLKSFENSNNQQIYDLLHSNTKLSLEEINKLYIKLIEATRNDYCTSKNQLDPKKTRECAKKMQSLIQEFHRKAPQEAIEFAESLVDLLGEIITPNTLDFLHIFYNICPKKATALIQKYKADSVKLFSLARIIFNNQECMKQWEETILDCKTLIKNCIRMSANNNDFICLLAKDLQDSHKQYAKDILPLFSVMINTWPNNTCNGSERLFLLQHFLESPSRLLLHNIESLFLSIINDPMADYEESDYAMDCLCNFDKSYFPEYVEYYKKQYEKGRKGDAISSLLSLYGIAQLQGFKLLAEYLEVPKKFESYSFSQLEKNKLKFINELFKKTEKDDDCLYELLEFYNFKNSVSKTIALPIYHRLLMNEELDEAERIGIFFNYLHYIVLANEQLEKDKKQFRLLPESKFKNFILALLGAFDSSKSLEERIKNVRDFMIMDEVHFKDLDDLMTIYMGVLVENEIYLEDNLCVIAACQFFARVEKGNETSHQFYMIKRDHEAQKGKLKASEDKDIISLYISFWNILLKYKEALFPPAIPFIEERLKELTEQQNCAK